GEQRFAARQDGANRQTSGLGAFFRLQKGKLNKLFIPLADHLGSFVVGAIHSEWTLSDG
ncbi:MAG: hypothetical protein JKX88_07955, partial [Marinicaulis sp.]|nr:hypothetical protein [Marinicaulis sp.]